MCIHSRFASVWGGCLSCLALVWKRVTGLLYQAQMDHLRVTDIFAFAMRPVTEVASGCGIFLISMTLLCIMETMRRFCLVIQTGPFLHSCPLASFCYIPLHAWSLRGAIRYPFMSSIAPKRCAPGAGLLVITWICLVVLVPWCLGMTALGHGQK